MHGARVVNEILSHRYHKSRKSRKIIRHSKGILARPTRIEIFPPQVVVAKAEDRSWWSKVAPKGVQKVKGRRHDVIELFLKDKLEDTGRRTVRINGKYGIAWTILQLLQLPAPRCPRFCRKEEFIQPELSSWVTVVYPLEPWAGWGLKSIQETVPYLNDHPPMYPYTNLQLAQQYERIFDVWPRGEGTKWDNYEVFHAWDEKMLWELFQHITPLRPGRGRPARFTTFPRNANMDMSGRKYRTDEFDAQDPNVGIKDEEDKRGGAVKPDIGLILDNMTAPSWAFLGEIIPRANWTPSEALSLNESTRGRPVRLGGRRQGWPIRQIAEYCYRCKTPFAILRGEYEALLLEFWIEKPEIPKVRPARLGARYHWIPAEPSEDEASVLLATYALGILSLSRRGVIEKENGKAFIGDRSQLRDPRTWIESVNWHPELWPDSEDGSRRGISSMLSAELDLSPPPSPVPCPESLIATEEWVDIQLSRQARRRRRWAPY